MGLHEEQRPAGRKGGHLTGHDPRAVFLRRGDEQQHVAGGQHRLEKIAVAVGITRPAGLAGGCAWQALRVGVGAVDEHDVRNRRRLAPYHAGLHRVERQPRQVDIPGRHDDRIHGRRPGHIAGGGDLATG